MCNVHPYRETRSLSVTVSLIVTEVTVSFFERAIDMNSERQCMSQKACNLERWQARNEGKIGLVAP